MLKEGFPGGSAVRVMQVDFHPDDAAGRLTDWGIIFAGTSLVLWIGELVRAFTPDNSSARP